MRPVIAKCWDRDAKSWVNIKGHFHRWAEAYEEFHHGIGNYAMAIIEDENGRVWTALPEDVAFLDKGEGEKC